MPLIRYEIGDIGVVENLPDGRQRLLRLEGRTNDFVRLPDGRTMPGLTFYYVSRSLLESAGFINEFIVVQPALDTIRLVIDAKRPLREQEKKLIRKNLDLYLSPEIRLEIEEVEKIQRPGSGKIKHFYSLIDN